MVEGAGGELAVGEARDGDLWGEEEEQESRRAGMEFDEFVVKFEGCNCGGCGRRCGWGTPAAAAAAAAAAAVLM